MAAPGRGEVRGCPRHGGAERRRQRRGRRSEVCAGTARGAAGLGAPTLPAPSSRGRSEPLAPGPPPEPSQAAAGSGPRWMLDGIPSLPCKQLCSPAGSPGCAVRETEAQPGSASPGSASPCVSRAGRAGERRRAGGGGHTPWHTVPPGAGLLPGIVRPRSLPGAPSPSARGAVRVPAHRPAPRARATGPLLLPLLGPFPAP